MCSKRAHCLTIGTNREENFSTKCAPSLKAPWLSPAHVDQGGPPSGSQSPSPGTRQTISLIEPLRSRASFVALSKHGRRRQGRWCWVRYAPSPADSTDGPDSPVSTLPQIGYAIGKPVGNAVVRNRIRRRLRPIVQVEGSTLVPGIYLIGVKSDQAAWISYEELQDDLRTTLAAASSARRG
jgi:ribonuclease P protein component